MSSETGAETRQEEIAVPTDMLYVGRVSVLIDSTGWIRTSAFAFNNSDNSWYNIETDNGGAVNLFARFNGVEKYFISLGNKSDSMDGDIFSYKVAILKIGQATYFFYNDVLKCQFSEEELAGYKGLFALNITSCADRASSKYSVEYSSQSILDKNSNEFKSYLEKIA